MGRGLCLELSRRDRQQLDELLRGGLQPVRTVLRALALRQMDDGQCTPAVGVSLGLSAKAVWQIAKRYQEGGLDRALFDGARPGKAPALDLDSGSGSSPWSARAAGRPGTLDRTADGRRGGEAQAGAKGGAGDIRILLQSHDLKPWREKNVVRGGAG